MTSKPSIQNFADFPLSAKGPSVELRRFSAGMRVITALLCTALLLTQETSVNYLTLALFVIYSLWAGWLLWMNANGRARNTVLYSVLYSYWIDVAWAALTMKLWSASAMMMMMTLVYPVALVTMGYGLGHGLLLALFALSITVGMLIDNGSELMRPSGWHQYMPLLLILGLVPAAALVARPMGLRLRWLAMLGEIETQLDPRRGLDATCAELVVHLRKATQADVVGLVLPSSVGAPAMIASREDGSFRSTTAVHARLEDLLSQAPACPMSYVARPWWDLRPSIRLHADRPLPDGLLERLAQLALTLDVHTLHVAPLTRYARHHGHFLVGYRSDHAVVYDVVAVADAAPELLRILEQATLVDHLQDECASHERARIGRDLHDSAIQPYLGLKYAVEAVALRIPPENPARVEVDTLAALVKSEISALRELISGLRNGGENGDSALLPSVRRQVRRFSMLFGIDVEITCPDRLATTRAIASALFHIINEVLNNIRKHTTARRVWITLSVQASSLRLAVRDDAGSVNGRRADDFHPLSLTERTAELNGSLHFNYPDSLNTELVIQIPL